LVDDDELVINSARHAHAQDRDNSHQDQQSDGDAKYLNPDSKSHSRSNRQKPARIMPRTCLTVDYSPDVIARESTGSRVYADLWHVQAT
jgi:hypothetical protein